MSDQYEMFSPMTCEDSRSSISSPESACGPTPSGSPSGQTIGQSGPHHAPASRSRRQAKGKGRRTSATFGPSLLDSSRDAALSYALANRLRAVTDELGSKLYELAWIGEYTPSGMWSPRLAALARPIAVSGCIGLPWPTTRSEDAESAGMRHSRGVADTLTAVATLTAWPTTTTGDHKQDGPAIEARQASGDYRECDQRLRNVVNLTAWSTPKASDGAGGRTVASAGGGNAHLQIDARLAAWSTPTMNDARSGCNATASRAIDAKPAEIGWTLVDLAKLTGWETPQARDHFPAHSEEYIAAKKAQGHGMANLNDSAQLAAHGPERIGFLLGPSGWEICPASGQLNPAHSRWLMGLPPEWCDCAVTAMQSLPRKRRRSSAR